MFVCQIKEYLYFVRVFQRWIRFPVQVYSCFRDMLSTCNIEPLVPGSCILSSMAELLQKTYQFDLFFAGFSEILCSVIESLWLK